MVYLVSGVAWYFSDFVKFNGRLYFYGCVRHEVLKAGTVQRSQVLVCNVKCALRGQTFAAGERYWGE